MRPIGNHSWCTHRQRSHWDQQPVEIMALAAEEAAKSLEPSDVYADVIGKCHGWFHGENDLHLPMADPDHGGGYDGLERAGSTTTRVRNRRWPICLLS
ncbi:hypothetical protein [Sporolactobacillus pectinivorans]|uniref:hypothetical protein n=1 Tax=Sporolactobacillus pectinivorans TaxID=1591408 RepID=UPI0013900B0A|nr:hypothetical protein [Sporolactobacillus pectinivorans]